MNLRSSSDLIIDRSRYVIGLLAYPFGKPKVNLHLQARSFARRITRWRPPSLFGGSGSWIFPSPAEVLRQ